MIIRTKSRERVPKDNSCSYCGAVYSKKDFSFCPHCGGDGGGFVTKSWRPTKKQKKEFAKKKSQEF